MARIRSIHPGIWTDEEFAALSMPARILYFGLLTEADDNGIFEWKPTGLKMRIFPADNVKIDSLLTELVGADKIDTTEIDGKEYGAVRNFRKYQRPKKPNTKYPITERWRTYVGLDGSNSEPVENQFGTGTEIPPQRKEEGGRREKEKKKDSAGAASSGYAFESGIIKLNSKDFERWKASFSHLDVPAELVAMTPWAEDQGKNWFHAVPNALAKRNREVKAKKDQLAADGGFKWNGGIEGVI